jgi:hypothetical protein
MHACISLFVSSGVTNKRCTHILSHTHTHEHSHRVQGKARVMLVTPREDILDGCPEGQRLASRKALTAMGAEILTGECVWCLWVWVWVGGGGLYVWGPLHRSGCASPVGSVDSRRRHASFRHERF